VYSHFFWGGVCGEYLDKSPSGLKGHKLPSMNDLICDIAVPKRKRKKPASRDPSILNNSGKFHKLIRRSFLRDPHLGRTNSQTWVKILHLRLEILVIEHRVANCESRKGYLHSSQCGPRRKERLIECKLVALYLNFAFYPSFCFLSFILSIPLQLLSCCFL
jgi:hypothetical protein